MSRRMSGVSGSASVLTRTVKRSGCPILLSIVTIRPATRAVASREEPRSSSVRWVRPSSDARSTRMVQVLSAPTLEPIADEFAADESTGEEPTTYDPVPATRA